MDNELDDILNSYELRKYKDDFDELIRVTFKIKSKYAKRELTKILFELNRFESWEDEQDLLDEVSG